MQRIAKAGWRWWMAILVPFLFGAAQMAGSLLPLPSAYGAIFAMVLSVSIVFAVLRLTSGGLHGAQFGLVWPLTARVIAAGLGAAVVFNLLAWAAGLIWPEMASDGSKLMASLSVPSTPAADIAMLVLVGSVAGVAEEFTFRAMLHLSVLAGALKVMQILGLGARVWPISVIFATLLSSLAFMTIHDMGDNSAQLPLYLVMGICFAAGFHLSGSLWGAVVAHVANNVYALTQGWWQSPTPLPAYVPITIAVTPIIALALVFGLTRWLGQDGPDLASGAKRP